ncbi:AAA family ATPase [Janthinobacterium aquaticum]|uniref:AAA family ATPase n=1 Tax=Janthinobacterium sp. FT58W TaxID=2654254 RepID=UPI00126577EB|nr:ATP-binding protein [Janthinobacterium sp. FT58W]KAB8044424.1 AAA family ATPase [Janthinobacterium sp. FT58W]
MIKYLGVSNFKSLVEFKIHLPKFTVLIGLNGAGKTTILQAFDFASQLMSGKIDEWLISRNWDKADIASKLVSSSNISFTSAIQLENRKEIVVWSSSLNRKELSCLTEIASLLEDIKDGEAEEIFLLKDRQYRMKNEDPIPVVFNYQGSLLSQLRDTELGLELKSLRDMLRNIRSLELLSPHLMRQRTRDNAESIGIGGEKLSAYLHSIKGGDKQHLLELLRNFYPYVSDFKSSPTKGGWKRLSIIENFDSKQVETEVRHINDGLLRVLAMLAQTIGEDAMLLFDEVENGVNPEIVEKLVDLLVNAKQQILVTTHNPMILNYLADDVARKAVQFVYKTPEGYTRVRPFFSLPGIGEKLELMGPGEAFVDTNLVALTAVCVELDKQDKANNEVGEKSKKIPTSKRAAA